MGGVVTGRGVGEGGAVGSGGGCRMIRAMVNPLPHRESTSESADMPLSARKCGLFGEEAGRRLLWEA